jgi:polyhydroxyalkanoate synthase
MEKWIFDSPDQRGKPSGSSRKICYQKNLLIKNELMLNGKKINLKNINALLNVMAEFDHLVPIELVTPDESGIRSDKETFVFLTGHRYLCGLKSQKRSVLDRRVVKTQVSSDGTEEEKPGSAKRKDAMNKKKESQIKGE